MTETCWCTSLLLFHCLLASSCIRLSMPPPGRWSLPSPGPARAQNTSPCLLPCVCSGLNQEQQSQGTQGQGKSQTGWERHFLHCAFWAWMCVYMCGKVQQEESRSKTFTRGPWYQMTHVIVMNSPITLSFLFFALHSGLDLYIITFFGHHVKSIRP